MIGTPAGVSGISARAISAPSPAATAGRPGRSSPSTSSARKKAGNSASRPRLAGSPIRSPASTPIAVPPTQQGYEGSGRAHHEGRVEAPAAAAGRRPGEVDHRLRRSATGAAAPPSSDGARATPIGTYRAFSRMPGGDRGGRVAAGREHRVGRELRRAREQRRRHHDRRDRPHHGLGEDAEGDAQQHRRDRVRDAEPDALAEGRLASASRLIGSSCPRASGGEETRGRFLALDGGLALEVVRVADGEARGRSHVLAPSRALARRHRRIES